MHLKTWILRVLFAFAFLIVLSAAPADEGTAPTLANSDPTYIKLRQLSLTESYDVANLVLRRDVGQLQLTGKFAFAPAVTGRRVLGVFTGTGRLILKPTRLWDQQLLERYTDETSVDEEFSAAVFWFTDETYLDVAAAGTRSSLAPEANRELDRVLSRLRHRRHNPQTSLEATLTGEEMDNFEAVVLADVMNSSQGGSFMAFVRGKKYSGLRYFVRSGGAIPQMRSSEEVALINYDIRAKKEGIWYLAHAEDRYANGSPASTGAKATTDARHYELEIEIGKGRIDAKSLVRFRALSNGVRVIKLNLTPELRVSSVNFRGDPISFIQEDRQADGSFYVVLPDPLVAATEYELQVAYGGKDRSHDWWRAICEVAPRPGWYPRIGSANDQATFDITFHYPKKFDLVSVGHLQGEPETGTKRTTSRWASETPLATAGFRCGEFEKFVARDDAITYDIESYRRPMGPYLARSAEIPSPSGKTGRIFTEVQASMRIFTQYFGPLPFGRLAITEQEGTSLPSLVDVTKSGFLGQGLLFHYPDQDTRSTCSINLTFSHCGGQATPHTVAHQWWGHAVGWESYHDQWISEGLADFSAGLVLQLTSKTPTEFLNFLERSRFEIIAKNKFGYSPNMAGSVWRGQRLASPRTPHASQLIYNKGGYVFHMLRGIMFDQQRGDEPFIEMMHDFVDTYKSRNATTEGFQAIVEKHMSPMMRTIGGGNMDWFFKQWVYGTEIPSYEFAYRLTPQGNGQTLVEARVTQSEVSSDFVMPATIYGKSDGKQLRLGSFPVRGSGRPTDIQVTLSVELSDLSMNANHDVLAREIKEVSY